MKAVNFFSLVLFIVINQFVFFGQNVETTRVEESLLWEISGNGLAKSSFLFGTIHMIPKEDFFFTQSMENAFDMADRLIMEVNLDIPLSDQIQLAKKMMLPKGKSLSDHMSVKEYNRLNSYLKDSLKLSKMSLKAIDKLKPMFSFSVILNDKVTKSEIFEMHFMKRAKKQKMEVCGLETMDEQLNIVDKIPIPEQVSMLMQMVDSGNVIQEYHKMVNTYKNQKINKLMDFEKDEKELAKYADDLLVNRNKKWIAKFSEEMIKSACFIAIGSGHLAGKDGLIKLLRAEGFELKPLSVFKK